MHSRRSPGRVGATLASDWRSIDWAKRALGTLPNWKLSSRS
jgi:hypothetical protein